MNNKGKTLKVEGLTKKIGEFEIKDINFELKPGVVTGLIGVNGSGKTTLMRTVMGSYIKDSGKLSYIDDNGNKNEVQDIKNELSFILEGFPFQTAYSAKDIGDLFGYYYEGFNNNNYKALLNEFNIQECKQSSKLSTGERIKLQTAFALSHDASVYIMDEPVGNLDVSFRDKFYKIIRDIVSDELSSVLISSHIIGELENIVDEIIWLMDGRIYFKGTIEELRDSYRIIEIDKNDAVSIPADMIIGSRIREYNSEVMIKIKDKNDLEKLDDSMWDKVRYADLKEIIYFVEKNKRKDGE